MRENIKIILFAVDITSIKEYAFEFSKRKYCKIFWLTFDYNVMNEIRSLGFEEKVFFFDLDLSPFKNVLLKKIINKIFSILKVKRFVQSHSIKKIYTQIKKEIGPDIWVTDNGNYLSNLEMNELKVNIFHSVTLKKSVLHDVFLNYDLLLLPNHFIKKRLIEHHQLSLDKQNSLKVVGWPKINNLSSNSATENKKVNNILKAFNLDVNKKTLMYAPSWDTFNKGYIFPKSFGDPLTSFKQFCVEISKLEINIIVKLHWNSIYKDSPSYHSQLRKIAEEYNVLFLPEVGVLRFNAQNEEILKIIDVLVSDVSGIISDYLVFDRPIIHLEPDHPEFNWNETDYPPNFRAGLIAKDFNNLVECIKKSLDNPAEMQYNRKKIIDILFYKNDGKATIRAVDEILKYYEN